MMESNKQKDIHHGEQRSTAEQLCRLSKEKSKRKSKELSPLIKAFGAAAMVTERDKRRLFAQVFEHGRQVCQEWLGPLREETENE